MTRWSSRIRSRSRQFGRPLIDVEYIHYASLWRQPNTSTKNYVWLANAAWVVPAQTEKVWDLLKLVWTHLNWQLWLRLTVRSLTTMLQFSKGPLLNCFRVKGAKVSIAWRTYVRLAVKTFTCTSFRIWKKKNILGGIGIQWVVKNFR